MGLLEDLQAEKKAYELRVASGIKKPSTWQNVPKEPTPPPVAPVKQDPVEVKKFLDGFYNRK